MRTPRQVWESERDDPLAWVCWVGGCVAVGLVMLMARLVVQWVDPVETTWHALHCAKPYHDTRCVQAREFEVTGE